MMNLISTFVSYITSPLYTLVSSPTWFFSAPGKIWGLSVPWRVGAFTGLSLTVIVSLLVFLQNYYSQELFGSDQLFVAVENKQWLALIAFLVLTFSVVIGLATHFWLMEVPSRFPAIDKAWMRGIAELQAAGIELVDYPLFLIAGIPDSAKAIALMEASGLKLGIKPRDESQPLVWFTAEKDGDLAIFLFLCTCCQTSLMSGGRDLEKEKVVSGPQSAGAARGTMVEAGNSLDHGAHRSMGYAQAEATQQSVLGLDSSFHHDGTEAPSMAVRNQGQRAFNTLDDSESSGIISTPPPARSMQRLTKRSAETAENELRHVARLLRTGRQPCCPVNGIISSVPFEMLKADRGSHGRHLGEVTRNDLTMLTRELGLRAHVLAVVHGLDADDDFRIFVKRMREFQSAADVDRRLGKGLTAWAEGTESSREMIEEVARCSCDAFQRLIYKFFSSTQSLKKVDNGQLFRFLAHIRGRIEGNLTGWLVDGFAPVEDNDRKSRDWDRLPQLAGCYFVAAQPHTSGMSDDDRLFAHAPGVFERLYELEGEIEWTQAAAARDLAYRNAANVFFLLTLAGLFAIVAGLWRLLGNATTS